MLKNLDSFLGIKLLINPKNVLSILINNSERGAKKICIILSVWYGVVFREKGYTLKFLFF